MDSDIIPISTSTSTSAPTPISSTHSVRSSSPFFFGQSLAPATRVQTSALVQMTSATIAPVTASATDSNSRWSSWPSWPRSWSNTRINKYTRVRRACDSCRSRKTGCSGDEPCKSCSRLNKPCIYTEVSEEQARAARNRKNNWKAKRGDARSEITEIDHRNRLLLKGWSPQTETPSLVSGRQSPPCRLPSVLRPTYLTASPRPPSFSSTSCPTTTATMSTATFLPTPSPLSSTSFDPSCSSVQTGFRSCSHPYSYPFTPESSHPELPGESYWSSHFPRSPDQDGSRWSSSVPHSPDPKELPLSRPISRRSRRPTHSRSISSVHSILPPSSLASSSPSSSASPCPSPLNWPGPVSEGACPEAFFQPAHRPDLCLLMKSCSGPADGLSDVHLEDQINRSIPDSLSSGLGLGLTLGTDFGINTGLQSMSVHHRESGQVELTYRLWGAD